MNARLSMHKDGARIATVCEHIRTRTDDPELWTEEFRRNGDLIERTAETILEVGDKRRATLAEQGTTLTDDEFISQVANATAYHYLCMRIGD